MRKNMLESLRRIVQEVNTAGNLQAVLDVTVLRVRRAMGTEVCSVYLREPSMGRLIFSATQGLNKDFVGIVLFVFFSLLFFYIFFFFFFLFFFFSFLFFFF